MTESVPTQAPLGEMSWGEMSSSERRDVLEDLVVGQFRTALLMSGDEDVPQDASYFDMGLTSLRLTAMRKSLEDTLDIGIDATVLFNRPTIEDLVNYLADLVATSEESA